MDEVRETIEKLRRARGDDYVALSRLLGRNLAYMQQFMRRGVPRQLSESDRRTLAIYFGVEETALGGPPPVTADLVAIPRIDVAASAGPGALVEDRLAGRLRLDPAMVRAIGAPPRALSAIRVAGDSMLPTLADGDEILVNADDGAARLRDGIYVLAIEDVLVVKRVALLPGGDIAVRSDNPAAPDWTGFDRNRLRVIGRVVWSSRHYA